MSYAESPVRYIEPRAQTETVLWAAALLLAVAAHLAAFTWASERMPDPAPQDAPVETEVTVEMIEMATQAAQPTVAEAEAVAAAEAPAPPEPAPPAPQEPATVAAAPERADPVAAPVTPAPTERVAAAPAAPPAPAAAEPVSEGVTRITGAPVAAQSGAAPAARADTAQAARAEEVQQAREATPARITAAPVVTEEASRAEVASAARAPEEVPETATARVSDDRVVAGQDEGRERLRAEAEVEAQEAVRETGGVQVAAAPEPAAAPAPEGSEAPPADTVAAASAPPERVAAAPALPEGMEPERLAPTAPDAEPVEDVAAAPPPPERESELPGPGTEGGLAAPAPESDISEADRTRYTAILDYLKTYDGGPCFAALPALGEETAQLTLDAFGPTSASLDGFRAGMEAQTGEIPNTFLKPVSEAQCAALVFIREARAYPAFNLYFDMSDRVIASGDYLEGRILNVSGQVVHFLLIDDEGTVQALDGFLQFTREGARFSIPMNLTAGPVVTQQLLLAVGTPARLDVVTAENGAEASAFFAALAKELEARGISPDLSMVAFSVE
ncbi:hypothetical protein [Vannielia litorea]|uniref:Uncharacterized protein n=1 Tax=Vannielia litorea TaxID=1217970 RepID=A0A1N6ENW1_9RHOB|nr:hypothetical protein [Vannielia litorea]SIN84688.1 hypothetical protein SAMN05444002_0969 [Vannielia litorea]